VSESSPTSVVDMVFSPPSTLFDVPVSFSGLDLGPFMPRYCTPVVNMRILLNVGLMYMRWLCFDMLLVVRGVKLVFQRVLQRRCLVLAAIDTVNPQPSAQCRGTSSLRRLHHTNHHGALQPSMIASEHHMTP